MKYIKKLPENPSFSQLGLSGYKYNLENKEIDVTIEDCFKGHDKYNANTCSTHIYYVLDGNGKFKINGEIYEVKKDDCIEIPPKTEFVFAGQMKLLLIMQPGFKPENSIDGKENDIW